MALAEIKDVLEVSKEKLFSVITNYEDYPSFVEGCKSVNVERQPSGVVRAYYQVNVMSQDVIYSLDLMEDLAAGTVEWKLVESTVFKKNEGRWKLSSQGPNKTSVTYSVDIDFKIPVPSFI